MKSKMSCFERRIETLFMLIQRRRITVSELSEMFSVCKNTAYNDISFLSRYAPIYTKNGINGGVFIMDGYRNELFLYLSDDEERCLQEIMIDISDEKKVIVCNILNKFSMPKVGV